MTEQRRANSNPSSESKDQCNEDFYRAKFLCRFLKFGFLKHFCHHLSPFIFIVPDLEFEFQVKKSGGLKFHQQQGEIVLSLKLFCFTLTWIRALKNLLWSYLLLLHPMHCQLNYDSVTVVNRSYYLVVAVLVLLINNLERSFWCCDWLPSSYVHDAE